MPDSFIQVAPDGAGKKMQTVVNTIGADSVHAEAVLLVGPDGLPLVTIPVSGGLTNAELRAATVPVAPTNAAGLSYFTDGASENILSVSLLAHPFGGSGVAFLETKDGALRIEGTAGDDSDILKVFLSDLLGNGISGFFSKLQDVDGFGILSDHAGNLNVRTLAAADNIAKAEDSASANLDTGVPAMAIRRAIPGNTSDADGDYETLRVFEGQLWVRTKDGSNETQGITTGAAVITDANGTLQQYLRGLVKLWAAGPPLTDARFDATRNLLPTAGQKLAVATYSPSQFKNLGANATLNVKASAGNVFSLSCYNANASPRYLQLHNTATTPAGSAVPVFSFLVPPSSQIIIGSDYFTNEGCNFATGIAFGFSTARDIYTAGAAGDQSTWIQYK